MDSRSQIVTGPKREFRGIRVATRHSAHHTADPPVSSTNASIDARQDTGRVAAGGRRLRRSAPARARADHPRRECSISTSSGDRARMRSTGRRRTASSRGTAGLLEVPAHDVVVVGLERIEAPILQTQIETLRAALETERRLGLDGHRAGFRRLERHGPAAAGERQSEQRPQQECARAHRFASAACARPGARRTRTESTRRSRVRCGDRVRWRVAAVLAAQHERQPGPPPALARPRSPPALRCPARRSTERVFSRMPPQVGGRSGWRRRATAQGHLREVVGGEAEEVRVARHRVCRQRGAAGPLSSSQRHVEARFPAPTRAHSCCTSSRRRSR